MNRDHAPRTIGGQLRPLKWKSLIRVQFSRAIRYMRNTLQISHRGAAQMALFAMLFQAMIPLSVAIPLPADSELQDGRSNANFYLVICTAFGAQTQAGVDGEPLDKAPSDVMPWDCPVCQAQTIAQGLVPPSPQVTFIPSLLPRGCPLLVVRDQRTALWSAAPGQARAPPLA